MLSVTRSKEKDKLCVKCLEWHWPQAWEIRAAALGSLLWRPLGRLSTLPSPGGQDPLGHVVLPARSPPRLLDHVPGSEKRRVPSQMTLHPHPRPVCVWPGGWIAAIRALWPKEQWLVGRGGMGMDRTWTGGLGTCESPPGAGLGCAGSKGDRLQAGGQQEQRGRGGRPRNGCSQHPVGEPACSRA